VYSNGTGVQEYQRDIGVVDVYRCSTGPMVSGVVQGYRCTGGVHGFRVTGCRSCTGVEEYRCSRGVQWVQGKYKGTDLHEI
jgi:hypothetical protein